MLPAVDARRGELQPHGLETFHLAVFGQVVAPLVGDDGGHGLVPRDAAGKAVLGAAGLEDGRAGIRGFRVGGFADGLHLHANEDLRALDLQVLMLVPSYDRHRLGAVAFGVEPHGIQAEYLGADAVGLALAGL